MFKYKIILAKVLVISKFTIIKAIYLYMMNETLYIYYNI